MIKIIAIDIDGTLIDSHGVLPEANRRAILDASARGVEIALATGRRYDFAKPIFDNLPAPLTLILSNGAVIKTKAGETLQRRLLPHQTAHAVLRAVPGFRDGAAVVFDRPREGQVVFEAIDWEHPRHQRFFASNRPFLAESNPLEDCLTEDPIQVMFTGDCRSMRDVFETLQREADGRYGVALTEYQHRDFSLVDVVGAGVSKGSALEQWALAQGYGSEDVMAVGDNLNDLEMLEFAGTAVVMGNAAPSLKSRGWAVTGDNDSAGLAAAIETYVLGGAS